MLGVSAALLLAGPAPGARDTAAAPTATQIRAGSHAAFVRVVVDFRGGAPAFNEVNADDPDPANGSARLAFRPGVRTSAAPLNAFGVRAAIVRGRVGLELRLAAAPGRFKYLSYFLLRAPDRLVVDLWRAVPTVAARYGRAGCLTISSYALSRGTVRAAGRERDLFEHSLVLRLRGARGGLIASRPLIAAGGRWSGVLRYSAPAQPATLEAASFSAKDGVLDCLVQLPVTLVA